MRSNERKNREGLGKGSTRLKGQPHRRGGDHDMRPQDFGNRALGCIHRFLGGPRAQGRRQQVRREGRAQGRRERQGTHLQGHHRHGRHRPEGNRCGHDRRGRHTQQEQLRCECDHRHLAGSGQGGCHDRGRPPLPAHRIQRQDPAGAHAQHHQRRQARRRQPQDPGVHDHPRRSQILLRVPQDVLRDLHVPQVHAQEEVRRGCHQPRRRGRVRAPAGHRGRSDGDHRQRGFRGRIRSG